MWLSDRLALKKHCKVRLCLRILRQHTLSLVCIEMPTNSFELVTAVDSFFWAEEAAMVLEMFQFFLTK